MHLIIALGILFGQANEEYQTAKKAYENKYYDIAALGFEEFLKGGLGQPEAADALFYLADAYLQLGKFGNAAEDFHRFAQQFTNDTRQDKAITFAFENYLKNADLTGGYRLFKDFPHRLSPPQLSRLAEALKAKGENQKSFEVFSSVGSKQSAFDAARALIASGEAKKARDYLREIAKADTANAATAYYEIIKSYLAEGDTLSALEVQPELKNPARLDPDASWQYAQFLLWQHNLAGAADCLNRAKTDTLLAARALRALAVVYRRAENYPAEAQTLKHLSALAPNDRQVKYDLAQVSLLTAEPFDKTTILYWNFADFGELERIINRLNERGLHQEALNLLDASAFTSPRKLLLRAKTCEGLKEYQKARDLYSDFINAELFGEDVAAAADRITYLDHYLIFDYEAAMKQILAAQNDEERGTVLFTLAKDYPSAVRYLRNGDTPHALFLLGQAYELWFERDKTDSLYTKAVAAFQGFLATFPQDSLYEEVLYRLLRLTERTTDTSQVISAYENFIYQYPLSRFADGILYSLARLYYQAGQYTVAVDRLNQLVPLFPRSPFHSAAVYLLAQADLALDDTLSATEHFATLALTGADSTRYLALRSLAALAGADLGRARSYLSQLISAFPDPKEEDRLGYLDILARLKEPQAIIDFVGQSPGPSGALLFYKGLALAELGHKTQALTMLYAAELPTLPAEYYYYRASIAQELGRPKLVESNLVLVSPGMVPEEYSARARLMLAQFYYQRKDYKKAVPLYEALLAAEPESMRYFEPLITSLFKSGNLGRADTLLRRYQGDSTNASGLQLVKISYYLETNQLAKAKEEMEKLAESDSTAIQSEEAQYDLALLIFKSGDFTQAATAFDDFLTIYPHSRYLRPVQLKLGTIYNRLGDNEKSLKYYQQASADDSLKLAAQFNIAYVYKELGEFSKAIDVYNRLLAENPDMPDRADVEFSLAYANLLNHDYLKAADLFRAIQTKTQDRQRRCEATYWLAESYLGTGRVEAAAFEYLKIPYNYPDLEMWPVTAEMKAAFCYELQGKLDKAKDIYKGIIKQHPNDSWGADAAEKIKELEKKQP